MLIDDFTSEWWEVKDAHFEFVWNYGYGPGYIGDIEVMFFEETGTCDPAIVEIYRKSVNSWTETATGNYYFGRQSIEVDCQFDPIELLPGDYWFGIQLHYLWGNSIAYWLTADGQIPCELQLEYEYWGSPRWTTSTQQWGTAYDVSWYLTGRNLGPPTPDVYVPCGLLDICVEVENLGTFDEPGTNLEWVLYEYLTAPPDPTYVDNGSYLVDLDVGDVKTECIFTYDFTLPGVYMVNVTAFPPGVDCYLDNNKVSVVIGVDCCPPESEFTLDPALPDGLNNWYVSPVEVCITAVDPPCPDPCEMGVISGVAEIRYELNGVPGSIPGAAGCVTIDTDGSNLFEFWAVDNVGNEEVHHTMTIPIDQADPSVDLQYETYEDAGNYFVDFEAVAADTTSGMNRVEFKKDGVLLDTVDAPPYVLTYAWQAGDGSKTFYAYAYDNAGNDNSDSATIKMSKDMSLNQQQTQELPLNLYKVLPRTI
jgi:hypothetical protein